MRLREEIRSHLPSPSESSSLTVDAANDLEALPYLNAVCNETLRLYPTVPITLRVSTRPTTILSHKVPKGTRIYLCPLAINRSPDLWGTTANDFIPDRWINADTGHANNTGGATSNYSILTFLHGPRSCVGEKFAKGEIKALLALFCGSFQFTMADPTEVIIPTGVISTKPNNGVKLRLQKLEGW
jgi:cytochrome P450